MFGAFGLISFNFIVARDSTKYGMKKAYSGIMVFTELTIVSMFFSHALSLFIVASIILCVANSVVQALIATILSQESYEKSQGVVMGFNLSYQTWVRL